ncbi:SHOCT domain-containing protein [Prochlorococcus sp. MIT 0702]|uniref:SHOCT domain-containing protein n=2 Tax=unclassified Prochlorococcus TaxID=2627481 RepID=UPI0039A56B91
MSSAWVPLVDVYYAISRRSITPIIHRIAGTALICIIIGAFINTFGVSGQGPSSEQWKVVFYVTTYVAGPFLYKSGIRQAKREAMSILMRHGITKGELRRPWHPSMIRLNLTVKDWVLDDSIAKPKIPKNKKAETLFLKRSEKYLVRLWLFATGAKRPFQKLEELKRLYEQGLISKEEYELSKERILRIK